MAVIREWATGRFRLTLPSQRAPRGVRSAGGNCPTAAPGKRAAAKGVPAPDLTPTAVWHEQAPPSGRVLAKQVSGMQAECGAQRSRVCKNSAFFSPGKVKSKPQDWKNSSADVIAITSRIRCSLARSTAACTSLRPIPRF